MTINEVIRLLQARGGSIGLTAQAGGRNAAWRRLDFQICECSRRAGPGLDYIARGPRGGIKYVGINARQVISCGIKGYHYVTGTRPCI